MGEFWFDGHHITVTLLGNRLRAERSEDPCRFDTPFHRLVYHLRTLLGIEGGRAWNVGRGDGTQLTGMAMARARAAEVSDMLRRRYDAPVAMRAGPPVVSGLTVVPAYIVDIIASFLPLADRLSLRQCVCRSLRAGGRQALRGDLALRSAASVHTPAQLMWLLSMLINGGPNGAAQRLSPEQKAAVLKVLARQLDTLPRAMSERALDWLFASAMTLDGTAPKAAALELLAMSVSRLRFDSKVLMLSLAIRQLPPDAAVRPCMALLSTSSVPGLAGLLQPGPSPVDLRSLLPSGKSWLDVVEPLPAERRGGALCAILRCASERYSTEDYAKAWQKARAETQFRAAPQARCRALSALGRHLPGDGTAADCWDEILRRAGQLPADYRLSVLLSLGQSIGVLPEYGRARRIEAVHAAGTLLPAGQEIQLRVGMLHRLPTADRAHAWEALWRDAQRNDVDVEQRVALGMRVVHALLCVPPLNVHDGWPNGWKMVLRTCSDDASLLPRGRAALLVALDDVCRTVVRRRFMGLPQLPTPHLYASRHEAGEVALRLALDHGEPQALFQFADSLDAGSIGLVLAAMNRLPVEERAAWLTPLLEYARPGQPDEWVEMALTLAEEGALGMATRVPLMVALVDRCARYRLYPADRLLSMARRADATQAPDILSGLAALADGMGRRPGRSAVRTGGGFMTEVWELAMRLPPAGLRAMLKGLFRRKARAPWLRLGGYDDPQVWMWPTLAHAVKATQCLAGPRADIVARLARISAQADIESDRNPMAPSAGETRRLIWEAITALPVGERARALFELPLWHVDEPRRWSGWKDFKPAFDEQCRHLPDLDQPVTR